MAKQSHIEPSDEEAKGVKSPTKLARMLDVIVENTTKVGTPFYLAPELLYEETRQSYTVKSDVWALGVIFYEMCALRKPFIG